MVNNFEISSTVKKIATWAEEHSFVRRVVLFGSRVRGDQLATSDLDIFIEVTDLRKVSHEDREDWKQHFLTDFASLRAQFDFNLDIVTEVPPDRATQTRGFIDRGTPLPDLTLGNVYSVSTAEKPLNS
jgi:predicted nucleotidyltransferase